MYYLNSFFIGILFIDNFIISIDFWLKPRSKISSMVRGIMVITFGVVEKVFMVTVELLKSGI